MPQTLTYPGVYIDEISSGVATITGVATSIGAFVGYTPRGRDNFATEIFSFSDFERLFGGLGSDSELSYAVQQFFQNGGTDAFVVRVPRDGAGNALVNLLSGGTAGANGVMTPGALPGALALTVTMLSSGTWSDDVIINVDYDGVSDTSSFNLTITDLDTNTVEVFDDVTMNPNQSNFVEAVVNDPDSGSSLVTVKASGTAPPAQSGTVGGALNLSNFIRTSTSRPAYAFNLSSDVPLVGGSPAINGVTIVLLNTTDTPPTSAAGLCQLLQSKINMALQPLVSGAVVSCTPYTDASKVTHIRVKAQIPGAYDACLTFAAPPATVGGVAVTSADGALNLTSAAGGVANVSHYWPNSQRAAGGGSKDVAAQQGATRGTVGNGLPTGVELIGDPLLFTGIYALEKVDLFNILCLPDVTRAKAGQPGTSDLSPWTTQQNAVWSAALSYCTKRRAFLIIDPPPEVATVANALDFITSGLTARDPAGHGAAYFPRLKLPDSLNNLQLRAFAPCGVVAGLYALTDTTRGVWKAPAGVDANLSGVQSLAYKMTDGENGALNPLGLNCFRSFPVFGAVSWGARTVAGADALASDWKYIPVRRFALFLEESLYRGTQWAVFEPNAEPLWAQISQSIGAFMQTLFRQGAFQGQTPQQAYFVKVDDETTTQNDINLGIVNILVGFAPLKPAEFVVITIQQMAGQIAT